MTRRLDFTNLNFLNDPKREAQLILARAIDIDQIDIDIWSVIGGSCGFRKGTWKCSYGGRQYSFFASVPHCAEVDKQREMLRYHAALEISRQANGGN